MLGSGAVARQQFLDALDRVVCDTAENVAQISFEIEFGSFDGLIQGVHCDGTLGAAVGAGEEPPLATQANIADAHLAMLLSILNWPFPR